MAKEKSEKKLRSLNKVLNVYTAIGIILLTLATVLLVTPALPYLWYRLNSDATTDELTTLTDPTDPNSDAAFRDPEKAQEEVTLPPFDPDLTKNNTLIIPKIKVNGKIHEGQDGEKQLDLGVWRVPDYGTPEDTNMIILASHRFGYITWSMDFRTKNSFYNLPDTKVGDKVEIIWNQRKYEYEIYKAEDNTTVTDYNADLLLYTCRMFNSPIRVWRYAKRVN